MKRTVVKLGGSTAYHAEMREWIFALAIADLPLVVVPGGGPFADQVRDAQKQMRFSDQAAHFMAILAMDQMGLAIVEMHDRLVPTRTFEEIDAALERREIPVWLPSQVCFSATEIPQSWDMTSDSLAAWLAGKMGAEALLLIKQTNAFDENSQLLNLVANGIVDPLLPAMLKLGTDFFVGGPDALAAARERFAAGAMPGVRIGAERSLARGAA
ncbi:dihydroneopterin aldolase [Mesorhizobium sp. CGMCC 1.15528]|uniref:Dihydroneopterin aldolase n=1 Tax=Mesorhizobium zhangyense TaxID=1776730 RepID=A0A7C9VBQ9_9HYPH|nr:dihydroneopterin aldolase [Mesorhizobium zhangyense]NGN41290.1 dihydroneopterin aldolase [Mesorhizobium zhangyense]